MDDEFSISQLADREAPALMMTEKLVICLRACTLFATTRRASRVRLTDSGAGFASELTLISNKGLDALADATKFLTTLRWTADSMAKPGGTLERLQSTIGVPAERGSHDRHMKRLEREIETCKKRGTDLEKKLTNWRADVEKFRRIVSKTNEQFIQDSEDKDAESARYYAEIESANKLLRQGEEEEAEAKSKYDESQRHQRSLARNLTLPETLNGPTVAGLAYTAIRLGWSRYTSGIAAQDLKKTQEDVERQRKSAESCKNQIAEAEIELQKLTGQSKQLDDFTNALTPTLRALVSLTDNLRALIVGFSGMESLLKMLKERQAETNTISHGVQDEPASLADVRDFAENARAMSTWALKIEHLSWLYASIIEHVLIGGLENVHSTGAAGGDGQVFPDTLDFFHAAQRQQLTLQGSGSSCNMIRSQVDTTYEQKRCAMEMRHDAERARLAQEEEEARKQARKQAEKEARSNKLKKFLGR